MINKETVMETEYMLTTIDNPYDYFTEFDKWFFYDTSVKGYYSCNYLARIAKIEDDMTQKEINEEIRRAIDEIIQYDFRNIFKRVSKTTPVVEFMDEE